MNGVKGKVGTFKTRPKLAQAISLQRNSLNVRPGEFTPKKLGFFSSN